MKRTKRRISVFLSVVMVLGVLLQLPVTAIADYAFEDTPAKTVIFPDSIISIGDYAFWNGDVENVVFGTGLISIGRNRFAGNEELKSAIFRNPTGGIIKTMAVSNIV